MPRYVYVHDKLSMGAGNFNCRQKRVFFFFKVSRVRCTGWHTSNVNLQDVFSRISTKWKQRGTKWWFSQPKEGNFHLPYCNISSQFQPRSMKPDLIKVYIPNKAHEHPGLFSQSEWSRESRSPTQQEYCLGWWCSVMSSSLPFCRSMCPEHVKSERKMPRVKRKLQGRCGICAFSPVSCSSRHRFTTGISAL